jgi:hypothetical protein
MEGTERRMSSSKGHRAQGYREVKDKTRGFKVRVAPQHRILAPRTPFDSPASMTFDNADRAQGWCDALNQCLGADRFIVEEVELESDDRPSRFSFLSE